MIRPRPGTALVRTIQTEDQLPGSRIHLLTDTVRQMTAGQMELVALGPSEEDGVDLSWLRPDDWLLVKPRTWIEAGLVDHWFLPQDCIIGVFQRP